MRSTSNRSMVYTELFTRMSLPLNIQLKFAGGTESAVHSSATLWPGAAADGPIIDMLCGPTAQRGESIKVPNINKSTNMTLCNW